MFGFSMIVIEIDGGVEGCQRRRKKSVMPSKSKESETRSVWSRGLEGAVEMT